MIDTSNLIAFILLAFGMVLTPGPNMIYLISRSISQGPAFGLISLGGIALGFVFYVFCAAFGITALIVRSGLNRLAKAPSNCLPCSTRLQNSRSLASRSPGALPAIKAALIAPIEVPITQSGSTPASCSA